MSKLCCSQINCTSNSGHSWNNNHQICPTWTSWVPASLPHHKPSMKTTSKLWGSRTTVLQLWKSSTIMPFTWCTLADREARDLHLCAQYKRNYRQRNAKNSGCRNKQQWLNYSQFWIQKSVSWFPTFKFRKMETSLVAKYKGSIAKPINFWSILKWN